MELGPGIVGKLNYYFPMGESGELMGLNSIFGALQVLHQIYTWNPEWKVLLHCQAGKNRSPTIKSTFRYLCQTILEKCQHLRSA
jgi:hypothetical protein